MDDVLRAKAEALQRCLARLRRGMTQLALADRLGRELQDSALKRPRARRRPAPNEPSPTSPHEP